VSRIFGELAHRFIAMNIQGTEGDCIQGQDEQIDGIPARFHRFA